MCEKKNNNKYMDITGQRYGRITAVRYVRTNEYGNAVWRVRCDCGVEFETAAVNLRNGKTRSCGCLRDEKVVARNVARRRRNEDGSRDRQH